MAWRLQPDGSYHRTLGDSEYALFAASASGVGDMFLQLSLRTPSASFADRDRVLVAWSLIRKKNPLLMSTLVLVDGEPRFALTPPADYLREADASLRFSTASKQELFSMHMDGPRELSNDTLSLLTISTRNEEILIFMSAPHFCGDGTTLHVSTHELIRLVTSAQTNEQLEKQLHGDVNWLEILPSSLESRITIPRSRLGKAACKINYLQWLSKEIGGHTLPRIQRAAKQTAFEECELPQDKTAKILAKCKANGVTVNHALAALCTIAWTRCRPGPVDLPIMLYTAASLRGHLPQDSASQTFLALAYFTISLPAFPPSGARGVWHRARVAKAQMQTAARSPLLAIRAVMSASGRTRRVPDDPGAFSPPSSPSPALPTRPQQSAALMGISLIGDLDRTYLRHEYGAGVELLSVGTASRLKPGGILLLGHSFGKKLVVQLCWDTMGFEESTIERFWNSFTEAIDEYLC
ncbi:hypothetical protein MKEN_00798500 [Mycena kentingensis (nom. inval.)]|nr:hypothetical protein MKEN_00798500 [Mycena kentingensis (nom. inval.)]